VLNQQWEGIEIKEQDIELKEGKKADQADQADRASQAGQVENEGVKRELSEEKDEKRKRMMEAAIEIFSGKLFHQVKMEEVASRAGVGKGTLYLYFESKEALFRQSFQYAIELYHSRLQENLEAGLKPREKLKKIVYLQLGFLEEHLKVIYLLVGQSMAPPIFFHEEVSRARNNFLALLEEIIEQGIKQGEFRPLDPALAARSYLGGIVSFLHDYLHEGKEMGDVEQLSEKFADLYFEGFSIKAEQKRGPEC